MILPGIGTRLYRHEPITALVVGEASPRPREVRVQRSRVLVQMVGVASCGVGLPDLDEAVTYRASIAIEDAARNDDPLPQRLAGMLAGQGVVKLPHTAAAVCRGRGVREGPRGDGEGLFPR